MPENKVPSHYVGIGASAGGLEALQDLFSHMPSDTGAAFIVAQHLSPDFKSMMVELLSKHTSMPIYPVNDGVELLANCIYLMPPRKNMLMAEGKLLLSDQMPDSHVHMPIDIFLRSLAEDQQHKAIGIVLSGTGSDSTRGIKALKESGGMVIVQEPSSAKFDGMPVSAYKTGLSDMVLSPEDMGTHLLRYINHPFIAGDKSPLKQSLDNDDEVLNEIFQLLRQKSSINFSQYKASTVARRIERRLGINQLSTLDAYLRLLIESPKEVQVLSKELLIGVTRFFRDEEAFNRLEEDIIPKVIRLRSKEDEVRIWVAGCSSGEEAYSLAILFDEEVNRQRIDCNIKIFATDVDERAIADASSGVYSADIVQDISPERLDKYFNIKDDKYIVSKHIRQMIIFAAHNVIEDPPFSNVDMVTCRNVLIYFQHAAQKKVLSSLYFSLQKDGYMFLGGSESLGDLQLHFETIDERLRIFKKTSNVCVPIGSSPPLRDLARSGRSSMSVAPSVKPLRASGQSKFTNVLERLIREYAPDCIVLNEALDAIHVYGSVADYTKGIVAGKISNNINDLVIDDLSVAVSTALHRSEKQKEDVFYKDVVCTVGEQQILIDLSIFYVKESELSNAPHYYVVQFMRQQTDSKRARNLKEISFDAAEQSRQRIRDLEQELIKKQEHLQVTIEELETTNEELQSANEELMSANEELQSTNEELQSVNEELYTVNGEYQEKITQLIEVNDDLDSVINSTDVGIVFLDEQLTIRKYTAVVTSYINLREGDIGRPFHHISHEMVYQDFLADVASVSKNGRSIERNIFSMHGQALWLRIVPYQRVGGNGKSGVLITITNISRQYFAEKTLQSIHEKLRRTFLEHVTIEADAHAELSVLLVDIDEVAARRVSQFLQKIEDRSIRTLMCDSVSDALVLLNNEDIDLCLVSYNLLSSTAKDFTRKLREHGHEQPVIVLSDYSEAELDVDFLTDEAADFLNKGSLSSQQLNQSIAYALAKSCTEQTAEADISE